MTRAELAKLIISTLESDDPCRIREYLTEDFSFTGPFPSPLNRDQFMEYIASIRKAFPDWCYQFIFVRDEDQDTVRGVMQRHGTHKDEFALPGMPRIPATDISVILPIEPVRFIFRGDRLNRLEVEDASGGGLEGILDQLGMDVPRSLYGIFDMHPEMA
jgi:hypothetical protein